MREARPARVDEIARRTVCHVQNRDISKARHQRTAGQSLVVGVHDDDKCLERDAGRSSAAMRANRSASVLLCLGTTA